MKEYINCLRCGRKLKTEESKLLGFGKICYEKWNKETASKPLFNMGVCDEKDIKNNSYSKLSNNIKLSNK